MAFKHDSLTIQCIFAKLNKPIIDEMDSVISEHYGLTVQELDFIRNYDIEYRMGSNDDDSDDE